MGRLAAYEEAFDEDEDEELGESEEHEIIAHLSEQGKGKRYEDSSFPANAASLYRSSKALPEYDAGAGEVKWLRPHELTSEPSYFRDGVAGAGDVVKGRLDDAWLLGALAVVAAHPGNLIENLFSSDPDDFNKYGVYTCRFYINGEWQEIVSDTRLPCIALSETADAPTGALSRHVPMYGRGLDLNELWVPLVEKAYAKLHGTYEALSGGTVGEALVDLTGGSCVRICLGEERVEAMVGDGRLWDRLRRYVRWQYVIACTAEDPSKRGVTADDAGIPVNAACSVVAMRECSGFRLVRVRNPWGLCEWTGDWSDSSPLWEDYPDVYAAVTATSAATSAFVNATDTVAAGSVPPWRRDASDGTFWMSYGDFTARFTHLYACRIFPDDSFRQYCVHGEWAGKTAGGAPHMRTSSTNISSSKSGRGDAPLSKDQLAAQARMKENLRRTSVVDVQQDGDPFWFNNPQYRLTVDKPTEVLVSLMQQVCMICNNGYFTL
jgi:Calpain family cysteine protease